MSEVKEFYVDDLVYKFDDRKRIMFGVVIDSYEASDTDEYPALQKGQILVLWNNHSRKQILKQNKVHLMSRCIIPGDIVRRLEEGRETQRGYCKTAKQFATVQIVGTDKIIENVNSLRLPSIKPFDVGDAVCVGNKSGRIQEVNQLIKMVSKCGSIVEFRSNVNYNNIRDYWMHSFSGGFLEPCYPGQTVICSPMDLTDPKWIKKSKSMKRRMDLNQVFTIQSADYASIDVWWYTNKGHTEFSKLTPDEIRKLKALPYSNNLEIANRCLIKLRSSDLLIRKKEWIHKKSMIYMSGDKVPKSLNPTAKCESSDDDWLTEEETDDNNIDVNVLKTKQKRKCTKIYKLGPDSVLPVDVLCTNSKVTIVWQDGTEEENISSTQLYYSMSLDDHEFFPGEWVVYNNDVENSGTYGVVQKVNNLERTAEVKWFNCSDKDSLTMKGPYSTNEISVYDLKKHHKFVFRPGSIVKSKPIQDDKMGRVIDSCPQGYVIVQWVNGTIENCWPQDIELIPESDEYEFSDECETDDEDDFSFVSGSWETESVESYDGDVTDQINLQIMATKVDFIRDRIIYLKEAFKQYNINKDFHLLKDLLCIYDNSRYLDKFLGTSFFSLESKHFQVLLVEIKKLAKSLGIDLKGRLFSKENCSTAKLNSATEENIQKMMQLESRINTQIEEGAQLSMPNTPETECEPPPHDNLTMELLLMLKIRMDLAYAEIISRIGGRDALTVLTNTSDNSVKPSSSNINFQPPTPDESFSSTIIPGVVEFGTNDAFIINDDAPEYHYYYSAKFEAVDLAKFLNALKKEYKLMKDSLPQGVWVRTYANRTDLLSVMIRGPAKTPYEDGLFLFDIQLSADYPRNPPLVHYIAYSSEGLNPNLYVEGKVCVSLLGTWKGHGSEVWGPNSTLLQLIVSIQGLILVGEPYYNEAGYEKQTNTQQGYENSRTYNELVILKLVQSMTELLKSAPLIFKGEILSHFATNGDAMCNRLSKYCNNEITPDFPLLPVSKGLKLSLNAALKSFQDMLKLVLNRNELGR